MLQVNDNIKIKFGYNKVAKNVNGTSKIVNGRLTFCTIEVSGKEYKGQALCAKGDNLCRDTGRKIAMKRALEGAPLNKQQKSDVWEAYRLMTEEPRWSAKKEVTEEETV